MGLMDKVNKLKDEAEEFAKEHKDDISKAVDAAKEHMPGHSNKAADAEKKDAASN
ncbi:MAG TPA: hypothetical protein VKV26_22835 [Dehalococcoidia bacterium]|nr:hypothetical protein [Dehalococcoidia bacterium]